MSVRTQTRVWDGSSHSGSELLMLLAIADFADDDGNAYPAVPTLAKKCRMSPRNANLILSALKASGELEVRLNEGPKGTNRYRVLAGRAHQPLKTASAQKQARPLKPASASTPEECFTPEARFTLKPASPTPEAGFPKPLKPASDEPSLNHQEPPEGSVSVRKVNGKDKPSSASTSKGPTAKRAASFDMFWHAYARKVAKDAAAKAFDRRKPDAAMVDLMVSAIEVQMQSEQWRKDAGRFIPHPATWLNEGRWQDEKPRQAPAELPEFLRERGL